MLKLQKVLFAIIFLLLIVSCTEKRSTYDEALKTAHWSEISEKAKGTTVNFMMWQGSPVINDYINNYVVPSVNKKYNIELKISGAKAPKSYSWSWVKSRPISKRDK